MSKTGKMFLKSALLGGTLILVTQLAGPADAGPPVCDQARARRDLSVMQVCDMTELGCLFSMEAIMAAPSVRGAVIQNCLATRVEAGLRCLRSGVAAHVCAAGGTTRRH